MACAPKLTGPTVPSGYVFSLQALPPSVVRLSANVGGEREQTERGMVATLWSWPHESVHIWEALSPHLSYTHN